MNRTGFFKSASLATLFLASCAAPALADGYSDPYAAVVPDEHSITVDGKYGTPSAVSGRVRLGPHGYQVQTPGGAWLNCTFNCAYTLRNATVDFWHRDDAPGGG